jgi:hypothetical protein
MIHPSGGHCRYFTYLDLGFRVQADSTGHLDWLSEFLQPAYSVSDSEKPHDIDILIENEEALFKALHHRSLEKPESSHRTFVLDNNVIELPGWCGEDDRLTLYQEKTRTFFELSRDRRQVRLTSAEPLRCRMPLMRVLREFTMNHYMQKGGVFLHASAVSSGDDGLLIVGSKNAGKTSMLTHFLRNAGADYVSNDRVYINPAESSPAMRGMPTVATIRASMPTLFPGMQEQLDQAVYQYHRTLTECRQRNQKIRAKNGLRYSMTPTQLLDLHAISARPSAYPRAMLFPRVTQEQAGIRAVRLSKSEVSGRVSQALYGISTLGQQPVVFNLTGQRLPTVEELLDRCQRVAESLPCFEIRLGHSAYENPRAGEELLAELLP